MKKVATSTADDLGRAHVSLLDDLRTLEQAFHLGPEASGLNVLNRLMTTHSHITDHFGFEEQSGWTDAVRKQEPRLEHAIQNLVDEHRELVQSLDTLIEEAEAQNKLGDVFYQKVQRWIERVREHETRENELLEDAFVEDLGAGD
jgi:hypothetical protein